MASAPSPAAQTSNMCVFASTSASAPAASAAPLSPSSPSSPSKATQSQAEQPAYPPYSLFHPPPYTPATTPGPAQERALLTLSSHKRSSYDAIPIDHTVPFNASPETRASLSPGAPPRFLPPSLNSARNVLSLDPSLKADQYDNADNAIVTNALAALNASRSMQLSPDPSPDPGAVEKSEQ